MIFKNFLVILSLVVFLVSPAFGATGVIFEDNFDTETSDAWLYEYNSFANWDVIDGTVDLISSRHPGFETFTDNGIFIDLDGTSNNAGTMRSKTLFEFKPGYVYELSFDLAGSQRPLDTGYNTVTVSLGGLYEEDFTLFTTDPFQTFQHKFIVSTPTSAYLAFEHGGGVNGLGDCVGLLLDNVKITSTIEWKLVGREYFPGILIGGTTVGAAFAGQVKNFEGATVGRFNVNTDHQGGPIEACGATNTLVRFKITMNFFDGRRLVMVMPPGETADAYWGYDDAGCPNGGFNCEIRSIESIALCDCSDVGDENVSLIANVESIPVKKRRIGSWGFDDISEGVIEGWLIHTPLIIPAVLGTFRVY